MEKVDVQREFRRHRIGRLEAARRRPVSVAPGEPLSVATTLMLEHDFTQLPVTQGDRTLKGIISWKSIGKRHTFGQPMKLVQDAMGRPEEASVEDSLFDVIPRIADHDCVIVRDETNLISGIVTSYDISIELRRFGEPYWRLEDLENFLRALVEVHYTPDDFAAVARGQHGGDALTSVDKLSFGDYVALFENPERWARLNAALDRATFTRELKRANEVRNRLMHFRNSDITAEEREFLLTFSRFVGQLARARAGDELA